MSRLHASTCAYIHTCTHMKKYAQTNTPKGVRVNKLSFAAGKGPLCSFVSIAVNHCRILIPGHSKNQGTQRGLLSMGLTKISTSQSMLSHLNSHPVKRGSEQKGSECLRRNIWFLSAATRASPQCSLPICIGHCFFPQLWGWKSRCC